MIYPLYNLLFPLGFLLFLPGLVVKLIRRPGWKKTFGERFAVYTAARRRELAGYRGAVWIHSVSVGETQIALDLIRAWQKLHPERRFVISTTTTTGQQLARDRVPPQTAVIFCPVDFIWWVRKVFRLFDPSLLVVLETELWPNMLHEAQRRGIGTFLVNGRMSDKSSRGYARFRFFFRPVLSCFSKILVQSEHDADRFRAVAPEVDVVVTGNLKFDRAVPEQLPPVDLTAYFGPEPHRILLASCTHPGEEILIATTYRELKPDYPDLRLVIVPRHAERAPEIVPQLRESGISFCRRTKGMEGQHTVDCLLADTTGEMFSFIAKADIVIMGKSLAGHNEGHNLIEPAIFAKPIVTGHELTNFRFVLDVLREADGVLTVNSDAELEGALRRLLDDPAAARAMGERAEKALARHRGATAKTITILEA
ncbi:MAG: 3-deoxy-D-manno-octulosonic acid transferase [Victivallales bacterium]|nr:3-deoxy-D-manno-octulosonic acid transferase [Victivallales bacterium]